MASKWWEDPQRLETVGTTGPQMITYIAGKMSKSIVTDAICGSITSL